MAHALQSREALSETEHSAEQIAARAKARQLLCDILPLHAREEFLAEGVVHVNGKRAMYRLHAQSHTEIFQNGRLTATSCMQLVLPTPCYDRMIAEYLLLTNNEALYWNKANIFPAKPPIFDRRVLLIGTANLLLIVKLILDLLG